MINIKNVSFSYSDGKDTLKDINLHINKGECILLCGKSGCGKTTVTKLINGLIPHFYENCKLSGDVIVNGKSIKDTEMYELSTFIGSVFQNPKSQFFHLNSDAELMFGLENSGTSKENMQNQMQKALTELNIEKLLHRNIFEMSGGEKQSLAFASVYAMNPDIYVLDEPTANLDKDAIELLKEQIAKVKQQGKTIVIAEHRLWFLRDVIDKAVYMENGEIINIYSKSEFLSLSDNERISMGLRRLDQNKTKSKNTDNKGYLSVENLSFKVKDRQVFKDITFSASNGEILGIIGNNGCGKTTLLRCLTGLLEPTDGTIKLNGNTLKKKDRNKLCYMIMQDVNHQIFSDSVWGECEMSVDNASDKVITHVISEFDLSEYKDNHPMALSGGQKQRLAIATGILSSKLVIVFDEPTSGLDYEHMRAVGNMLRNLSQNGHIVIVVTHDNELLECCADRILRLGD